MQLNRIKDFATKGGFCAYYTMVELMSKLSAEQFPFIYLFSNS